MNIRENIKAYLDDELTPSEREQFESAMKQDDSLKGEVAAFESLTTQLRQLVPTAETVGKEKVMSKIVMKRPWYMSRKLQFASAGTLMFAIIAIGFLSNMPRQFEASGVVSRAPSPSAEAAAVAPSGGQEYEVSTQDSDAAGLKEKAEGSSMGQSADSVSPNYVAPQNRMVIKNGSITLNVESITATTQVIENMAVAMGGYVENSQSYNLNKNASSAAMTLRVKSDRYTEAMRQLRELGTVTQESSSGEDVTAQYADLVGRIKVLRAEEEAYVVMLRSARRLGDVLSIKDRLTRVRQEISSLQEQEKYLKGMSSLSTISVGLNQRPEANQPKIPEDTFSNTFAGAVNLLRSIGVFLLQVLIYVGVTTPLWLPFVLFIWWRVRVSRSK